MEIGVSIVSYNTKDFLRDVLSVLTKGETSEKLDIWVLDNNSLDGSAEMVQNEFKKVNLIRSDENTGFSKGHDILIKEILQKGADFILILNPDTKFRAGEIDKLSEFIVSNDCGVASGVLQDLDGHLQSNGGDFPFTLALINWLFNFVFDSSLANFHQDEWSYYQNPREVDWVGGTFMMVRKDVFEKVGTLNEDYFMYFEDVEFCYRVKKAGFKIMINPEVKVKHASGASSKDPRYNQWRGEFAGLLKFYNQYFGFLLALFVRLLVYIAVILRIIAFALMGKSQAAKTYGKVLFSI